MPRTIRLQHPIEIAGEPVSELQVKRKEGDLRMGDLMAVQWYAREHGYRGDVADLLAEGDIGALLVLVERLCGLPRGAAEQIHPDDFPAVVEALTPFFEASASREVGTKPAQ